MFSMAPTNFVKNQFSNPGNLARTANNVIAKNASGVRVPIGNRAQINTIAPQGSLESDAFLADTDNFFNKSASASNAFFINKANPQQVKVEQSLSTDNSLMAQLARACRSA